MDKGDGIIMRVTETVVVGNLKIINPETGEVILERDKATLTITKEVYWKNI